MFGKQLGKDSQHLPQTTQNRQGKLNLMVCYYVGLGFQLGCPYRPLENHI